MKSTRLFLFIVVATIFCACSSDEPDVPTTSDENKYFEMCSGFTYKNRAYFKGEIVDLKNMDIYNEILNLHTALPQNTLHIEMKQAGSLAKLIKEASPTYADALKITGPINEDDFAAIVDYTKKNYLILLDLSDAQLKDKTFPDRAFASHIYNKSVDKEELLSLVICHIKLPKDLENLGYQSLANLLLKDIVFPRSLKHINCGCFEGNSLSGGSITFPDNITYIPSHAFTYNGEWFRHNLSYDAGVDRIIFSYRLKKIGDYAFQCLSAKEIVFNEGLEEIGNYAFQYNQTIESITLPSTIKRLGYGAFSENNNLKNVYCLNPIPPRADAEDCEFLSCNDAFDSNYNDYYKENLTLYVPKGSRDAYLNAPCWQDFKEIIEIE